MFALATQLGSLFLVYTLEFISDSTMKSLLKSYAVCKKGLQQSLDFVYTFLCIVIRQFNVIEFIILCFTHFYHCKR